MPPSRKTKEIAPRIKRESDGSSHLNVIAEGTTVKGTLTSSSDTRMGGKLDGELKVDGTIYLTEDGFVDGSIHGKDVNISGSVKGVVTAANKVFLTGTAKIEGTISANRLVMEDGAIFNGECHMGVKSKDLSSSFVPSTNGKDKKLAKQPA
ncbi:MAG: polymer-forming cytoskeletal protein [Bacteroidetes bacterium]|nr:polymer-forming cytoskeletal protein [Bacteroidota bacterium]MCY4225864.1 polymer-forming cytoskeletal protein [Bacteroidota bacterium]